MITGPYVTGPEDGLGPSARVCLNGERLLGEPESLRARTVSPTRPMMLVTADMTGEEREDSISFGVKRGREGAPPKPFGIDGPGPFTVGLGECSCSECTGGNCDMAECTESG